AMKIVTLLSSGAGTGALRRLVVRVNGQTMTGDELARVMIENGVVGQNFARSEVLDHGARGILSAAEVGRRSVPVGVNSVEELRKLANRRAPILRSKTRLGEYWNLWFRANGHMNDAMRATAFLSFLDQGDDVAEAVRRTLGTHFDYGDLTRSEQQIARRVLPFYSWLRNNLAYQLRLMAERPEAFNIPGHLKEALETAIVGEQQVPEHNRPAWMREQMMLQ